MRPGRASRGQALALEAGLTDLQLLHRAPGRFLVSVYSAVATRPWPTGDR